MSRVIDDESCESTMPRIVCTGPKNGFLTCHPTTAYTARNGDAIFSHLMALRLAAVIGVTKESVARTMMIWTQTMRRLFTTIPHRGAASPGTTSACPMAGGARARRE